MTSEGDHDCGRSQVIAAVEYHWYCGCGRLWVMG